MTSRRVRWVVALAAATIALIVVCVPVWLIQPFAPQTSNAVAWSWRLRQVAPLVTLAMALVALGVAVTLWPRSSPLRGRVALDRLSLVLLVALTAGTAWFARQNHFEWQFRPYPDPRFVAAANATDVPPEAPVLGVASAAGALAFPITRLGYHHLVNAALGDVPIVATY